jgi:uncharacterized protein
MKKILYIIILAVVMASVVLGLDENGFTASGWVNDFAGIIDPRSAERLVSLAGEVNQKTGAEIAIVTIKSLEGDSLEDFSTRLFKHWGIGKKGQDNGILILVAYDERKIRIEVGYGLEALINDAFAGGIIREAMAPDFKAGNYGAGILEGAAAISLRLADFYKVTLTGNYSPDNTGQYGSVYQKIGPVKAIFLAIFFVFMLIMFIRHPVLFMLFFFSGRGYRGGGGLGGGFGGGGFGGFGGGMSGGGGASGGW